MTNDGGRAASGSLSRKFVGLKDKAPRPYFWHSRVLVLLRGTPAGLYSRLGLGPILYSANLACGPEDQIVHAYWCRCSGEAASGPALKSYKGCDGWNVNGLIYGCARMQALWRGRLAG